MLAPDYSITLACDLLDCPRSSYYYQGEQPDEAEIEAAIRAVVAEWPTYGYRRVTAIAPPGLASQPQTGATSDAGDGLAGQDQA